MVALGEITTSLRRSDNFRETNCTERTPGAEDGKEDTEMKGFLNWAVKNLGFATVNPSLEAICGGGRRVEEGGVVEMGGGAFGRIWEF